MSESTRSDKNMSITTKEVEFGSPNPLPKIPFVLEEHFHMDLSSFLNREVFVELLDGEKFTGYLECIDYFDNLAIINASEIFYTEDGPREYERGRVIVRGDNLALICQY